MEFQELGVQDLIGPINEFEQKHAPKSLYVRGSVDLLLHRRRVSVVGSRKCSNEGIQRTEKLVKLLVKNDVVVVSGLAKGIDATAHNTAIVNRGSTAAVIGTPLDKYYPKEHKSLQEIIATNHLLISQFAIGERTFPSSFPQRNRTMALLSDATVIVEASESSGSLSQGWEAIRLGRQLWILASVANDSRLKWPTEMINYGATVLGESNFDDLMNELPDRKFTADVEMLQL